MIDRWSDEEGERVIDRERERQVTGETIGGHNVVFSIMTY